LFLKFIFAVFITHRRCPVGRPSTLVKLLQWLQYGIVIAIEYGFFRRQASSALIDFEFTLWHTQLRGILRISGQR